MSSPSNPIIRGLMAVGTMGASEVVRAGVGAGKALVKGENVWKGTKNAMSTKGHIDRLTLTKDFVGSGAIRGVGDAASSALQAGLAEEGMKAAMPKMPAAPTMANLASMPDTGTQSLSMSPASSIRNRRNFSTLLTSPTGVSGSAVEKKTLLGGSGGVLGR